jgi:hypothetical protein
MLCQDGRCQVGQTGGCLNRDGDCCGINRRCRGGVCVANYTTFADCGSRCSNGIKEANVTVCGQTLPCPDCAGCQPPGCLGWEFLRTPDEDRASPKCVTSRDAVRDCRNRRGFPDGDLCPPGSGCDTNGNCLQLCVPPG